MIVKRKQRASEQVLFNQPNGRGRERPKEEGVQNRAGAGHAKLTPHCSPPRKEACEKRAKASKHTRTPLNSAMRSSTQLGTSGRRAFREIKTVREGKGEMEASELAKFAADMLMFIFG